MSGLQFVYLGAGRTDNDAGAVIAYSPVDMGGRVVLFGDGHVAQLSSREFEETMQRGYAAANQAASIADQSTAAQPAPVLGAAFAGGVGGGVTSSSVANGNAPAAPGQGRGPMAQGIRPIRIDIPRTGQKFTFTKVLNVGDEALKKFFNGFGDSFLSSVTTGGEYYAVYTFYTQTKTEQASLVSELKAKGMQYNEVSPAEHDRMSQIAKPVSDKFAAAYDQTLVKLYNDELARIRK